MPVRKLLFCMLLVLSLALPASALEMEPPQVPKGGQSVMPDHTESFGDGLLELLGNAADLILPELEAAARDCRRVLAAALVSSLAALFSERTQRIASLAGTVTVGAMLLQNTDALIGCAAETLEEICTYGKLLCPVMTAALAAQGSVTASAALYTGTTAFISLLSMLVTGVMMPLVSLFLTLSVGYGALGEEFLKKTGETVKRFLSWLLKTVLILFTTYMSITGVVSGTTDAAARKAAKVALSSVVPVVGGILSDASDSVLVSMGVVKNAAGIYGILAVLAVLAGPFVKIGVQYLILRLSAAFCSIWGNKNVCALLEDFSAAMGLLLGMVASGSVLVLISTVCFLKGTGL